MASPTRRTGVWVSSRNWWWSGKPGMLQSMGSQRAGHDWVSELTELPFSYSKRHTSIKSNKVSVDQSVSHFFLGVVTQYLIVIWRWFSIFPKCFILCLNQGLTDTVTSGYSCFKNKILLESSFVQYCLWFLLHHNDRTAMETLWPIRWKYFHCWPLRESF